MDAEKLRLYLNSLSRPEQDSFAERCGTTMGYFRKAISAKQQLGESLVINIERESDGVVVCESLRPDVDWSYLRGSSRRSRSAKPRAGSGGSTSAAS